jgi:hypothetical protein
LSIVNARRYAKKGGLVAGGALGALILAAVVLALAFPGNPLEKASWQWFYLQLNRSEAAAARRTAREMSSTHAGVRLASRDIDIYGGKTRGWSSWIMRRTEYREYAMSELREAVCDRTAPLARRAEACLLLAELAPSREIAKVLYGMVRAPDGTATEIVRSRIIRMVDDPVLRRALEVKANEPIGISLEEFCSRFAREEPLGCDGNAGSDGE